MEPPATKRRQNEMEAPPAKRHRLDSAVATRTKRFEYLLGKLNSKAVLEELLAGLDSQEGQRAFDQLFPEKVFPKPSKEYCHRCQKQFDPNYDTVCVVDHPQTCVDLQWRFRDRGVCEWGCNRCNSSWEEDNDYEYEQGREYDDMPCYEGKHETSLKKVRKEGWPHAKTRTITGIHTRTTFW
jgi:hypothetical protein